MEEAIEVTQPAPKKKGFFKKFGERASQSYGGEFIKKKYGEYKQHSERRKELKGIEEESYQKEKTKYAGTFGKARAKQEYKQKMQGFKGKKQPDFKPSSGGFMGLTPNRDVLDFRPSGMAFGPSMKSPFGELGSYALNDRNRLKKPKTKKSPDVKIRMY